MTETDRLVLDATVANKWHLLDEQHRDIALRVRQDFEDDRIELIAPSQLRFEVAAAILKATRNPEREQRLDPRVGERMLEVFQSWRILYLPSEPLALSAYRLARQYGCSYYDGLYVALAQAANTPLLHADNKLRRAPGNAAMMRGALAGHRPPRCGQRPREQGRGVRGPRPGMRLYPRGACLHCAAPEDRLTRHSRVTRTLYRRLSDPRYHERRLGDYLLKAELERAARPAPAAARG